MRRFKFPLLAVVVVLFAALVWAERTPILTEAARLWVVRDPLQPADAIAVLGGGENLRPFVAAELYKEGLADKILVANVKRTPIEMMGIVPTNSHLLRDILLKLDIPPEAIISFGVDVSSTFEEALALTDWARDAHARAIIVPTELFSARRQRWILSRELALAGAHAVVEAHKPLEYDVDNWWRHEEGLIGFQNEVVKYIYYRLKY